MVQRRSVQPIGSEHHVAWASAPPKIEHARCMRVLVRCYNWALWGFLTVILFAQISGVFWSVVTAKQHAHYGQDPTKGIYPIEGYNDEPYSDRMIACVLQGRLYKPIQVKAALDDPSKSVVVDTTGSTVNGYRVCARAKLSPDSIIYKTYLPNCDTLVSSLDGILSACTILGYNVTRDALRVVDDVRSSTTKLLLNSLPVMIMPYWDNSYALRFAIPGLDGSACVFRLTELRGAAGSSQVYLHGINRTVREETTAAWLGRPGGEWRNGWYEDGLGMRWYSDLISTNPTYEHAAIIQRELNVTLGASEVNWRSSLATNSAPSVQTWGASLSYAESEVWYNSVAVSNGSRYGLFLYESLDNSAVTSKYGIDVVISNLSLGLLLFRWLIAIITLQHYTASSATTVGIGCLSSFRNFTILPILLLPRLKITLAAFFTVGCFFEGEQKAFAEAWFVVYPAIGEFVLFYFSLLSLFAKLLRRRISDVLFGPTLLFFYLMHLFRFELAQSGWFEFDGRIATVVLSQDFEKLKLTDFLATDAALRMNGNIKSLFVIKMMVLALNLIPFVWSSSSSGSSIEAPPLEVENTLAVRAITAGGLGRPFQYEIGYRSPDVKRPALLRTLPSYEFVRLGYVVLADRYLISVNDWLWFMVFSLVRSYQPFSNLQVCVFEITRTDDGSSRVHPKPRFVTVNNAAFINVSCRDISLRPLR